MDAITAFGSSWVSDTSGLGNFTDKENEVDSAANVLDLDISINVEGKFSCKVYDKRDNFGFKVVKFQPLHTF